jgi:hypothetical protein
MLEKLGALFHKRPPAILSVMVSAATAVIVTALIMGHPVSLKGSFDFRSGTVAFKDIKEPLILPPSPQVSNREATADSDRRKIIDSESIMERFGPFADEVVPDSSLRQFLYRNHALNF